jgi:hypothetical protein
MTPDEKACTCWLSRAHVPAGVRDGECGARHADPVTAGGARTELAFLEPGHLDVRYLGADLGAERCRLVRPDATDPGPARQERAPDSVAPGADGSQEADTGDGDSPRT